METYKFEVTYIVKIALYTLVRIIRILTINPHQQPPPLPNGQFAVYAHIKIISSITTIIFTCRITYNFCLEML